MRYVTFTAKTGDITTASNGPPESHLQNLKTGELVGEAAPFDLKGAMINYFFQPSEQISENSKIIKGVVKRKPKNKWDHKAEAEYEKQNNIIKQFYNLEIINVDKMEVYLTIPVCFYKLPDIKSEYVCNVEGIHTNATITRFDIREAGKKYAYDQNNFIVPKTEIKFALTGGERFIEEAISSFNEDQGDTSNFFTEKIATSSCFKHAIRVANCLIESYRVAYDDPDARPIGVADPLNCIIQITLREGHKATYQLGNLYSLHTYMQTSHPGFGKNTAEKNEIMQNILLKPSPPFLPSAIVSLKTAHLYGQYRDCVVWAATIISYIIEDFLLNNLPHESKEYKKLKNDSGNVKGKTKMKDFFKVAAGKTLAEYLSAIIDNYPFHCKDKHWLNLNTLLPEVLNNRNLLLHRKKGISSKDADEAFFTCMTFVYAFFGHIPYSLHSTDFNLRLMGQLL